jgi:hypothetical protein
VHRLPIGVALPLLAGEGDGNELLVDQDAADIDHCRQVQQVDQHQLVAHAQPAQQAGEHPDPYCLAGRSAQHGRHFGHGQEVGQRLPDSTGVGRHCREVRAAAIKA